MDTVLCPSCREENPSKFRLCGFCGTPLAPPPETVSCPGCGEDNPGKFRLCGFCGTPLQSAPPVPTAGGAAAGVGGATTGAAGSALGGSVPMPVMTPIEVLPAAEVRKPATFIFVDLKGSTALTERIDQEAMNEIKKRYFGTMAAQIERHGGTVEKYIGDAIMAVFGIPKAREDDALRAVRAAHGMQQELVRLNAEFLPFYGVELANRTGVNTGEVVANTDPTANQQLATGDTVNVAARLEQAAPANEILIGETTYDLVRSQVEVEPVEPLELKGKSERVMAYRLLSVRDTGAEGSRLAHRAPLIGRDAEMARIREAFAAARDGGGAQLVTLIGEAGVGKSRILDDLESEVGGEATVVRGRCLPYGDGITFWPIVEIVRDAAAIVDDDSPDAAREKISSLLAGSAERDEIMHRLSSVIGLSPSQFPVAEVFWAARKFLEVLAASKPVVVLFEDIHYAEPTFLDLVQHLIETVPATASVLILSAARLPLLEKRADWAQGDRATRIELAALADADTGRLVEALFGAHVQSAIANRIVRATEGNPLFTEQLVSLLVDKGHVRETADGWVETDDLSDVEVPPTIQALLAARLDDLTREERATIEPASVIGLVFAQPAVAELVPAALRPAVPIQLSSMDRKQLLQRQGAAETELEAEDDAYRFRNLLIRDATYGSLLKRARAQLHERFVEWAERVNRERGREEEFEEILGYHLEQAYRYRTELGPIDAEGRSIAARAATKLGNAGRRAFGRTDLPAAVSLLGRAVALLQPLDPSRVELLVELSEALLEAGRGGDARGRMEEAHKAALQIDDSRITSRVELLRLRIELYTADSPPPSADAIAAARATIAVFETAGDAAGLARAWRLLMIIHANAGQLVESTAAAERAVEYAAETNELRIVGSGAIGYAAIALRGPQPTSEVERRCRELLDLVRGDRRSEGVILGVLAQLRAMEGAFDEAREMATRARQLLTDLGPSVTAFSTSTESSRIEVLAGDLPSAEALLRRDDEQLAGIGERYFRSLVVAMRANVVASQGRVAEASALATLAASLADEGDVGTHNVVRMARARVAALEGRWDDAIASATEAVNKTESSIVVDLADSEMLLGELLLEVGRADEARTHLGSARQLYGAKGDIVSMSRVNSLAGGTFGV